MSIVPLGAALITAMIARFGADAVAGFGVATRIEALTLVGFYALSSVIGPFVGQNYSAGHEHRILRSLRLCAVYCLVIGLGIALLLALGSGWLPTLFSDSNDVTRVTRLFLLIAPVSYGFYGIVMVMNASFNGLGKPMPAVYISVARILVLYVPLALVGGALFGIGGIFAAFALANIATGVAAYLWARSMVRRLFAASA